MEEGTTAFKTLMGKSTEKIPSGRPRRRWEDNIRMDLKNYAQLQEIGLIRLRILIIGKPL